MCVCVRVCVYCTLYEKDIGRGFESEQVKEVSHRIRVGRHAIVRPDALSDYATDSVHSVNE